MNYFGAWLCGVAAYAMRETFYERLCSLWGDHTVSPLQLAHARYLFCKYAGVVVYCNTVCCKIMKHIKYEFTSSIPANRTERIIGLHFMLINSFNGSRS